ncbi:MAG: DUF1802 family protein [Thermosynechococcaceae cyanobacterium]
MTQLSAALKEWAIAIDALLTGETIVLLRKGGIREQEGKFEIDHRRVLLYPTYEHQRSHLLKSGQHIEPAPPTIHLKAWAQITAVAQVSEQAQLQHLMPYHIWTDPFATERLNWKPQQPISVLLLRTYALPQPVLLNEWYGGCRSWIELKTPIDISEAIPVLKQAEYELRSQNILAALQTATQSSPSVSFVSDGS